jgi:hypothetical protein
LPDILVPGLTRAVIIMAYVALAFLAFASS